MRTLATFLAALYATLLTGTACLAGEEGATPPAAEGSAEGGEHKAQPEEKPRPDSAISSVSVLPVVVAWSDWMKSQGGEMYITGEAILLRDDGQKCWGVAVGEQRKDAKGKDHIETWRHFCVTSGGSIWVERLTASDPSIDEPYYSPYDRWVKKCEPTPSSPGSC